MYPDQRPQKHGCYLGDVQKSADPIFVTKNGYNDMVIMSAEVYDRIRLVSVYEKLMEAETDIEEGCVLEASASLRKLRERYGL